ncbi:MAG: protein kinase [Planctomycetaceae bacterium]|nr:protein kinase [Planctomycetaceae bacterium]
MTQKTPDENKQRKSEKKTETRPAAGSKPADSSKKMFSKYEIQKKLGSGGMGSVYLAKDIELGRPVALKILPKDKADNPTLLKRFKSEAQAAANLKHDNIVMVYGAGEHEGYYYMVMEYVEGVDVHRLISKKDKLSVKRSIEIIKQVAAALDHIGSKGIVHRDIKPSNLFIQRDGTVKLGDLGLARSLEDSDEAGVTRAGTTVGTVDYISPEQARNSKAADIRSDIYSLGCTWYHMLTGLPPYPEGSLTNKLHAHAVKPPPNPQVLNEAVPDGVVAIMHRMMAKRPEDRYQTPEELIQDLERSVLTQEDIANTVLASLQDEEDFIDTEAKTPPPLTVTPVPPTRLPSTEKPPTAKPPTAKNASATSTPTPGPMTVPANSSIRKIAIPQRVDGSTDWHSGDTFKMQVDPLKLVLMGGGSLLILAGIIYGGILLFEKLGFTGPEEEEVPAPTVNQIQIEEGETETEKEQQPKSSESQEEKLNAVTVQTTAEQETKGTLSQELFPQLDENQRAHLQNYAWLSNLIVPEKISEKETISVQSYAGRRPPRGTYETLELAWENLSEKGGFIKIAGDQPLSLTALQLKSGQRVILQGVTNRDGSRPLIMVEPTDANSLIRLVNGTLIVENLDFFILPPRRSTSPIKPLFLLDGGELCLRNVTLSAIHPAPFTAIKMVVPDEGQNHAVTENTVVRGAGLTVIDGIGESDELIAVNSLFCNRSAPLFTLQKADGTGSSGGPTPPLNLQLFSCTLGSGRDCLSIPADINYAFRIYSFKNLFASLESGQNMIRSFSPISLQKAGGETPENSLKMQWQEQGSFFSGWSKLIGYENEVAPSVETVQDWNQFWGQQLSENQVRYDVWGSLAAEQLKPLSQFDASGLLGSVSQPPGTNLANLAAPDRERLFANYETTLLSRFAMQLPLETEGAQVEEFKVPDDRDKFMKRLQSDEWADNTHFVLKGTRNADDIIDLPWEPAYLAGKNFTIEFKPAKSGQVALVRPMGTQADKALITVENANVRFLNLAFDVRTSRSGTLPHSVLEVIDGSFLFEHCLLQSTFQEQTEKEDSAIESLIRWKESETVEKQTYTGRIIDSFFCSFPPSVHSTVEQSRLQILNSCLISGSNIVRQEFLPVHTVPVAENFWTSSTLSCWEDFLELTDHRDQPLDSNSVELELFHLFLGPAFLNRDKTPEVVHLTGASLERPFMTVTVEEAGLHDSIRSVITHQPLEADPATVSSEDNTASVTGFNNPFATRTDVVKVLSLKTPLPDKLSRYVSPLYYEIDPNIVGQSTDGGPAYGADLARLPSLAGGKRSAYTKGSNNKSGNLTAPTGSRKIEF